MSKKLFDKRVDNFFKVENVIFERTDLDPYEKLVYILLCRFCNNGDGAFPSYETIAKATSISRRKAIDVIKSLIEKKLIEKKNRTKKTKNGGKENASNVYYVLSAEPFNGSEYDALGGSACDALGSECDAPGVVHDMHPKKNNIKKNNIKKNNNNNKAVVVSQKTSEIINKFREIYGATLDKQLTQKMIKEKGFNTVKKYVSEYGEYLSGRKVRNVAADFYCCVMNEYQKPVAVDKQEKSYANFEQREYTEADYEKFYYKA